MGRAPGGRGPSEALWLTGPARRVSSAVVMLLGVVSWLAGAPVRAADAPGGASQAAAVAAPATTAATAATGSSAPWGPAPAVRVVRFAPERDYGPFVYAGPGGRVMGLSVDMLEHVAAVGGLSVQTLPARPLSEILDAAARGDVDLVSSLRPTPERARFLDFTAPYVEVPAVVVTRAADAGFDRLPRLADESVAVGRSYAVESWVRQRYPRVHWVPVPDDAQGLALLRTGQVRAVVADVASVAFYWQPGDERALHRGDEIGFAYPLSFAVRKGDADLLRRLNAGLASVGTAGRTAVLARWLPAPARDPVAPRRERWIAVGVASLGAGLVLSLAWVRRARRRAPLAAEAGSGAPPGGGGA